MDIDLVKSVAQIAFWICALILALLTYRNARKTLLSPVNTEYQKRIFDTLTQLSERLCRELKIGSSEHLIQQRPMQKVLEEIFNEWLSNKESVEKYGLELTDWSASQDWYNFLSLADEIRYSLFIPSELKEMTIAYLESRAAAAEYAHNHAVQEYIKLVNREKSYQTLSPDNYIEIENLYRDGMTKASMSIDQIYRHNEALIQAFTDYVQSFDPK